jgi:hypothetical protein
MEQVGEDLSKLAADRKLDFEALQNDESFIDTVIQATRAAVSTKEKEKLEALRNAVLNIALSFPIDDSLRQIFLNLVDEFTVWHLRLLKLFQNPRVWMEKNSRKFPELMAGGLSDILEAAYAELSGKRDFYDQIWRDLSTRGFVNANSLHTTMSGSGLMAKRTTALGDQFLNFIEKPS